MATEAFEQKPDIDPPTGCSWLGEWEATFVWDTTMADDAEGDPVWFRDALQHDGHEDCCHHTRFTYVPRLLAEGAQ